VIPLPSVVQEASADAAAIGADAGGPDQASRSDRPERPEGERGGRRSRRGGRRRRREPGEAGPGQEAAAGGEGPPMGGEGGAPEPQSFDFERPAPAPQPPRSFEVMASPPRDIVPAVAPTPPPAPAPVHEPRPEWTPAPPSDATREGPRNEP
jgi:ribonuclease E